MHIGPEEAGRMDLKTYEGVLHNWNKMHDTGKPDTAPDMGRLGAFLDAHSVH